jgi:hypothetical protein
MGSKTRVKNFLNLRVSLSENFSIAQRGTVRGISLGCLFNKFFSADMSRLPVSLSIQPIALSINSSYSFVR